MQQFFKDLLEYNYYYNQKLADIFKEKETMTSEKSLKLFNHLLNAHQLWNNRIEPQETPFGVWELHALRDLKDINEMNYQQSLQILDTLDLNKTIHYSNSKGEPFSNRIQDMLFHIINHASYHRGQIASEFKKSGIEPLPTDYIFYKR